MLKVNNIREKKEQINDQDILDFLLLIEEKYNNDPSKLESFIQVFQNFQESK